jgi:RecA/RadA recombinase
MLTAEDSLAHTIRPRLDAARADIRRVQFAWLRRDGLDTSIVLPDDVDDLRGLIVEHEARLVVIDPLMAHLSATTDSWKDQKVRQALAPLHRLAEQTGAAVLVIAHLNKGQGKDPLQRLGGSIGIPAAARSVLLLGRDPSDPDAEQGNRRVLAHVKSNLGHPATSLAFAIEGVTLPGSGIDTALIREDGISPYGGSELLVGDEPGSRGSRLAEAIAFLEAELGDGERPAKALLERAKEVGISPSTLDRAKDNRRVRTRKLDYGRGWAWRLPPDSKPGPDDEPEDSTE